MFSRYADSSSRANTSEKRMTLLLDRWNQVALRKRWIGANPYNPMDNLKRVMNKCRRFMLCKKKAVE
jgi:hypothetical protein